MRRTQSRGRDLAGRSTRPRAASAARCAPCRAWTATCGTPGTASASRRRDFRCRGAVEVLHADRPGQVGLERVVDVAAGQLLEDGAGGVEVPVVVELVGSRPLRPARRRAVGVVAGVGRRVVHARPRGDQVLDRGLQFLGQQAADVGELESPAASCPAGSCRSRRTCRTGWRARSCAPTPGSSGARGRRTRTAIARRPRPSWRWCRSIPARRAAPRGGPTVADRLGLLHARPILAGKHGARGRRRLPATGGRHTSTMTAAHAAARPTVRERGSARWAVFMGGILPPPAPALCTLRSAFCILHFALCILHFPPSCCGLAA